MSSVDRMDIAQMLVMIGGTLGIIGLKSGIKSLAIPSVIASGSAIALTIYDIIECYKFNLELDRIEKETLEYEKAIKRQEELEKQIKKTVGLGD